MSEVSEQPEATTAERLKPGHRQYMVHMTHCNQGEHIGGCKYGEHDICPSFSTDPTSFPDDWSPLEIKRAVAKAQFLPLCADLPERIKVAVFRHTPGWLNEERFFEAGFADEKYARDFVSMMESQEYTWTVVTIHRTEYWRDFGFKLGTVTEFNGGLQVSRTIIV